MNCPRDCYGQRILACDEIGGLTTRGPRLELLLQQAYEYFKLLPFKI